MTTVTIHHPCKFVILITQPNTSAILPTIFYSTSENIVPDLGDSDDPDGPDDNEGIEDDDYYNLLNELSRKWLAIQLTHKVSLKATDSFWKVAVAYIGKVFEAKQRQGIRRKVPQFIHQRKQIFSKECPRVSMNFAFKNNDTQEVHVINNVDCAPLKRFQNNPKFTKLYEEAYVDVSYCCLTYLLT